MADKITIATKNEEGSFNATGRDSDLDKETP